MITYARVPAASNATARGRNPTVSGTDFSWPRASATTATSWKLPALPVFSRSAFARSNQITANSPVGATSIRLSAGRVASTRVPSLPVTTGRTTAAVPLVESITTAPSLPGTVATSRGAAPTAVEATARVSPSIRASLFCAVIAT